MDTQHLPKVLSRKAREKYETSSVAQLEVFDEATVSEETTMETTTFVANIDASSTETCNTRAKKYDKRTCCIYCNNMVLKFPRHLNRHHKDEEKVRIMNSLPVKSKQRLQIISELRKRGNFFYNYKCLEQEKGELIVKRRPHKNVKKKSDFLPCANCLGYYSKRTLNRHVKRCDKNKNSWRNMQSAGRCLLPQNPAASKILQDKILPELRDDEVGKIIKADSLILLFGSDLAIKFCQDQHLSYHIRQRMRELGRLLVQIKEIDTQIKFLADIFRPKYCDVVLQAIKNLTEFSEEQGTFGKPTTLIKLRTSLTSCADLLQNQAIQSNADEEKLQINNFLSVMRFKLKRLCALANQTLVSNQWNKPLELPTNSDIQIFNRYLETTGNKLYNKLLNEFNYDIWSQLSKVILVKIIVFNRKRVGEAQMMKIKDFEMRHTITKESDIYKTLSEVEKKISQNYFRIQVRGKHRRGVPILISRKQVDIINLIIKYRIQAGVAEENPYVFGRKQNSFIRATDAIRILSSKAGLGNSKTIRSIKLRKQIATQAQVINLKENELDDLAGSLGHDIRIHRSYYRLPDHALQIAKTGKILVAMDQGKLLENQGKDLDDIQVQLAEEYDSTNELSCPSTTMTGNILVAMDQGKLLENQDKDLDDIQVQLLEEYDGTDDLSCRSTTMADSDDIQQKDLEPSSSGTAVYTNEITPKKIKLRFKKNTPKISKRKLVFSSDEWNSDSGDEGDVSETSQDKETINSKQKARWITPEKAALKRHFSDYLLQLKAPGKAECLKVIKMEPILKHRRWDHVKSWIHNTNKTTMARQRKQKKSNT